MVIYCLDIKSGYMFWHLYKNPRIIEFFARKTLVRFLTTLSIAHLHVTLAYTGLACILLPCSDHYNLIDIQYLRYNNLLIPTIHLLHLKQLPCPLMVIDYSAWLVVKSLHFFPLLQVIIMDHSMYFCTNLMVEK